ncbi:MAG: hypothetical protein K2X60_07230 [Xanthobacteraceae bacterium]|nr:hypothetical protein [Xanthobacteraceae bacterium]
MTELSEFRTTLAQVKYESASLKAELKFRKLLRAFKANFDPAQPRDEYGKWTDGSSNAVQAAVNDNQVTAVFADGVSFPFFSGIGEGSDESSPDGNVFLAGATITRDTARTGIQSIDETTEKLTKTLMNVMDAVDFIPEQTGQAYGMAVHAAFAVAVRFQDLPGIGTRGVEQSFAFGGVANYGVAGSIRTDVAFRNVAGEVIAIYDVKTGGAVLRPSRAEELRFHTNAGPLTPVIELHFERGSNLKHGQIEQNIWHSPKADARHNCLWR